MANMPCKSKTPLHDINEPPHKFLYSLVAGFLVDSLYTIDRFSRRPCQILLCFNVTTKDLGVYNVDLDYPYRGTIQQKGAFAE